MKMYVSGEVDPNVSLTDLTDFVFTEGGGELTSVIDFGNEAGILFYIAGSRHRGNYRPATAVGCVG